MAALVWGPRATVLVVSGWSTAAQVLDHHRQFHDSGTRIQALEREAEYAQTDEGKDLEAKRRFGVGPPEEIWITIEAEKAREPASEPQTIDSRLDAWLDDTGSGFMGRLRRAGAIVRYWLGWDTVDECVVAPPEAEGEADSADEPAGDDEEAEQ